MSIPRSPAGERHHLLDEANLRLLLGNTSDAVLAFSSNREPLYLNPAVERLTGYSCKEVRARKFINWIHPDDQRQMLRRWEELYQGRGFADVEFRMVTKCGSVKWCSSTWGPVVDHDGRQIGVLGRERDISDWRRAHEDVRNLLSIFENSDDAILYFGLDGRILRSNRSAERIYGRSGEEMLGQTAGAVLAQCGHKLEEALRDVRAERSVIGRELTHRREDGSAIPISITAFPFRDHVGRVAGVLIISRDMMERNRLEREVAGACTMERRRIAHELHDGLAPYLHAVAYRASALQQSLEQAKAPMSQEACDLTALVRGAAQSVRNLARGQDYAEIAKIGFAKAMRGLAAETRALFRVRCQFACGRAVKPEVGVCLALYRIFREAIHNAIRHGNASVIRASAVVEGGDLLLRVRDDGVGFNPSRKKVRGMGLRLMAYRAREVGGRVHIESALGGGACVECRVPLRQTN